MYRNRYTLLNILHLNNVKLKRWLSIEKGKIVLKNYYDRKYHFFFKKCCPVTDSISKNMRYTLFKKNLYKKIKTILDGGKIPKLLP